MTFEFELPQLPANKTMFCHPGQFASFDFEDITPGKVLNRTWTISSPTEQIRRRKAFTISIKKVYLPKQVVSAVHFRLQQQDDHMLGSALQRCVHVHKCSRLQECMQSLLQTSLSSFVQGSEKATYNTILDHSTFIVVATLLAQQRDMCCHMACTACIVFANLPL